ncbi:hypothetical protein HGRIS_011733 [Hohenbuehelia grisea]|uniref:SPX domain-containing protein n=1 Tax=Hohenbuehelia grisea TaxID=104357 RepID=A0ABR3JWT9_9AGAR
MKFARYLQETQTPEWKRAYIDYRGLKKKITAVRRAQDTTSALVDSPASSRSDLRTPGKAADSRPALPNSKSSDAVKSLHSDTAVEAPGATSGVVEAKRVAVQISDDGAPMKASSSDVLGNKRSGSRTQRSGTISRMMSNMNRPRSKSNLRARDGMNLHLKALPLHTLLPTLSPVERSFFAKLDSELEKIESFYLDREKEMQARTQMLKEQLNELGDHRKRYYAAHADQGQNWASMLGTTHGLEFASKLRRLVKMDQADVPGDPPPSPTGSQPTSKDGAAHKRESGKSEDYAQSSALPGTRSPFTETAAIEAKIEGRRSTDKPPKNRAEYTERRSLNPEEYLHAKKKLKKAVLEHYRALETLKNYRILNLTGFRKALKKFEKVTKIPAQQAYMSEKVDTSAVSGETIVNAMVKDMEDMYALRFERGDKKKAMTRLRAGKFHKSHHFSTFRSGMLLGLAVPAFVSGLYQSFQSSTRVELPGWDALLFIYGILFIPTIFSLLVGVNLLVWSLSRINYVFIFELDVRTKLDHREYFETPAILLATLCYAFWLSFSRIGPSTLWPLIWLAFAAIVLFEPLPILFRSSRFWFLRSVGKLLVPGMRRVEFTDFWMGDQFCSLVWTLSNLYTFACVYVHGFDRPWRPTCSAASGRWPVAFVLAALPFIIRLLQSLRRYADSGLVAHLINVCPSFANCVRLRPFLDLTLDFDREASTPRGSSAISFISCGGIAATAARTWRCGAFLMRYIPRTLLHGIC